MQNYVTTTLDEVCINQECFIKNIIDNNSININRLLDLGFVDGAKVTPLFRSMFGDTYAYKIKGSMIGLRKKDCKYVFVKLIV